MSCVSANTHAAAAVRFAAAASPSRTRLCPTSTSKQSPTVPESGQDRALFSLAPCAHARSPTPVSSASGPCRTADRLRKPAATAGRAAAAREAEKTAQDG